MVLLLLLLLLLLLILLSISSSFPVLNITGDDTLEDDTDPFVSTEELSSQSGVEGRCELKDDNVADELSGLKVISDCSFNEKLHGLKTRALIGGVGGGLLFSASASA